MMLTENRFTLFGITRLFLRMMPSESRITLFGIVLIHQGRDS